MHLHPKTPINTVFIADLGDLRTGSIPARGGQCVVVGVVNVEYPVYPRACGVCRLSGHASHRLRVHPRARLVLGSINLFSYRQLHRPFADCHPNLPAESLRESDAQVAVRRPSIWISPQARPSGPASSTPNDSAPRSSFGATTERWPARAARCRWRPRPGSRGAAHRRPP